MQFFVLQDLRENPVYVGEGCCVQVEIKTQGDGKVKNHSEWVVLF